MTKPALKVVLPIDDAKVRDAYSELESDIRDLERMAILASLAAEGGWVNSKLHQEMVEFTIFDVEKRAGALRTKYYDLWKQAGGG